MKRRIFPLIAHCFLLAACHADDPDNLFGTTQPEETVQRETAEGPAAPVVPDQGYSSTGIYKSAFPQGISSCTTISFCLK